MSDTTLTQSASAPAAGPPDAGDLATAATRELAEEFAAVVSTGDRVGLEGLMAEHVVYLAPGRSAVAGLHRGRSATVSALTVAAAQGTEVTGVDVTELMADGHRAFVTLQLRGTTPMGHFRFELGLHLQTDGEAIVGITEYSGDQYTADALLATPSPDPPPLPAPKRRRFSFRRR